VHGLVRLCHRRAEFVQVLEEIHGFYPADWKARIVCDRHSAHVAKETQRQFGQHPGRFEFVFTPVHASWLNLAEVLCRTISRSVLRGMRVDAPEECSARRQYWDSFNAPPAVLRWKYGLDGAADGLRPRESWRS